MNISTQRIVHEALNLVALADLTSPETLCEAAEQILNAAKKQDDIGNHAKAIALQAIHDLLKQKAEQDVNQALQETKKDARKQNPWQ